MKINLLHAWLELRFRATAVDESLDNVDDDELGNESKQFAIGKKKKRESNSVWCSTSITLFLAVLTFALSLCFLLIFTLSYSVTHTCANPYRQQHYQFTHRHKYPVRRFVSLFHFFRIYIVFIAADSLSYCCQSPRRLSFLHLLIWLRRRRSSSGLK